jgi:hypothetical protein
LVVATAAGAGCGGDGGGLVGGDFVLSEGCGGRHGPVFHLADLTDGTGTDFLILLGLYSLDVLGGGVTDIIETALVRCSFKVSDSLLVLTLCSRSSASLNGVVGVAWGIVLDGLELAGNDTIRLGCGYDLLGDGDN